MPSVKYAEYPACSQYTEPCSLGGNSSTAVHCQYCSGFLPVCFPLSLESTPGFSPSTTHKSLQFQLTQSYEWHFSHRFHRLTTLIIHHPVTLSFQASNLSFQQILSTAFLFFLRTDSTVSPDCLTVLLSVSVFTFYFFFSTF